MKVASLNLSILAALLIATTVQGGEVVLAGSDYGNVSIKVTSLKEARFRTTVRQQFDYSCGSAATATLLTYQYGRPVSEQDIFQEMWDVGDKEKIRLEGFSLLDIKRYLENNGYQADGYVAPLDKLVQNGIPALALIRDNGYNHFVVIKGLNEGEVLAGDPSIGSRIIPRADFEKMWINRILFVIHSDQDKAVFNSRHDWHVRETAPLGLAMSSSSLANVTLLRPGPNDF
jgi:predicted double-glycine peptidase